MDRLWKQINENNDPGAMNSVGNQYMEGEGGLLQNLKRADWITKMNAEDENQTRAIFIFYNIFLNYFPDGSRIGVLC